MASWAGGQLGKLVASWAGGRGTPLVAEVVAHQMKTSAALHLSVVQTILFLELGDFDQLVKVAAIGVLTSVKPSLLKAGSSECQKVFVPPPRSGCSSQHANHLTLWVERGSDHLRRCFFEVSCEKQLEERFVSPR